MDKVKIIALKESVLEDNDQDAQALREELRAGGTCLLNLMSAPGSGKTTTLLALNKAFDGRIRWGVMEADIDSAVDANTMLEAGVPSVQLHTGGMTCDMLVVNKIDTLPIFDFDKEKMEGYARARNPEIEIFYISAKTGEGVQELADVLVRKVKEWNAK